MANPPNGIGRSSGVPRSNEGTKLVFSAAFGVMLGYLFATFFPAIDMTKLHLPSGMVSYVEDRTTGVSIQTLLSRAWESANSHKKDSSDSQSDEIPKIYVPTNPKGAERLPPGIVVSETDLYLRRSWCDPSEDITSQPRYLVTFTVGVAQKANIDAAVKKFSDNFSIMLFHYDGRTTEWDEFEWSKRAIHVWYTKRFLHPDVVSRYEYIFIWDEDLDVEHFNAEAYIKLVRKHGLEISQPGATGGRLAWKMTIRRSDQEVHKATEERPGWCTDPHLPPCAAYVKRADLSRLWRPCSLETHGAVYGTWFRMIWSMDGVWTLLLGSAWSIVYRKSPQGITAPLYKASGTNDCMNFQLNICSVYMLPQATHSRFTKLEASIEQPAHEKIGVVDAQWIVHQAVPSLGNQGKSEDGRAPWEGVRERCNLEWEMFRTRLANAEKAYYLEQGITPPNSTRRRYSR
ncbi:hypothetical protein ACP70R_011914 [Stipagrostis hirtigluma subsp. patula]